MRAVKAIVVLATYYAVLLTSGATILLGQQEQPQWRRYLTEPRHSALTSPHRGQGSLSTFPEIANNPAQPAGVNGSRNEPAMPAGSKPRNIQPLPRTLFNTPNFYLDRNYRMPDGSVVDLWMDPRYYHCNSMRQMTDIWTRARIAGTTAEERERSTQWGDCSQGTSVENIQSPYPFTTARAHYDVLMAEAVARGGPTHPSSDWLAYIVSGQYRRVLTSNIGGTGGISSSLWFFGRALQQPQFLSLLTP